MNLLLTNDDGINSEGILALAEALRAGGKYAVYILAPDLDRSGVSHGLSIFNPQALLEKSRDNWTCSGLPVDCVIAAVMGEKPCKPDIIVSGINRGVNVGTDLLYSGTAAAARQGALMGIPSIALSLERGEKFDWEGAARYAADHLEEYLSLWKNDIFINVNIPGSVKPSGTVLTWPARKNYNDSLNVFKGPYNQDWCYLVPGRGTSAEDKGSDIDALSRNLVSISPVYIHPVVRGDLCPNVPDYASVGKRGG